MGSEHGGLDYKKLRDQGVRPEDVLDFSVSINPDPLPEPVVESIRNSCVTRYPDSSCGLLTEKICGYNRLEDPASVLVVNGTSQGMFLIVHALLGDNEPVSIVTPTYSEYEDACALKTSRISSIPMAEEEEFRFSLPRIIAHLESRSPRLLWLCSPNNPTGSYLREEEFEAIRQVCLRKNTIFLLDEAYICFVPDALRYPSAREGVIVLRSMTKDFSIPGLRLGYLMGDPGVIGQIRKWQPEWSISSPAQDAGIAGFEQIDDFRSSWLRTAARVQRLRQDFQNLGLQTFPSHANFFLMKVPDLPALKEHLWKQLILVRDCSSFHLRDIIRIGIGTEEANDQLYKAVKEHVNR